MVSTRVMLSVRVCERLNFSAWQHASFHDVAQESSQESIEAAQLSQCDEMATK